MLITHTADVKRKLTPEEREMLKALKDRPIEFDEDNPELTAKQLAQFKRVSGQRPTRIVEP